MHDVLDVDDRRPDSRAWPTVPSQLPVRQLRTSAVVLGVLTLTVALLGNGGGLGIDGHDLALIGASLTVALTCALGWLNLVIYRVADDPRSLYIAVAAACLAVLPLMFGTVLPSLIDWPALDAMRSVFALAAVPGLIGIGMASRSLEAAAAHSPRRVVLFVLAGSLAAVAVGGVLPWLRTTDAGAGVPLPLAGTATSAAIAAGFAVLVVVHLMAARRRSGQLLSWSALAAAGIGSAYAISAFGDQTTQAFAWLLVAGAVAVGLYGAVADLQRHHSAGQRHAFGAVVEAFEATAKAQAVHDEQAERRHEARSALLGIEAAAQSLARHRSLLTPVQYDELSAGLVAEVYRLRMLVEAAAARPTTFDLGRTVAPVVSCLRAKGLDVRADIPPGISIQGVPEHTAQVLVSLLTNARRHAPGSPVDVRAEVDGDNVTVYVDDRGPGVPASLCERVFHRGAQAQPGEGSGLGLFISRRLMEAQHASIRLQERPGGGSSFVLRFPTGQAA